MNATRTGEVYGTKVKMVVTEVVNDQNIKYLNTDDDDEPGVELYVTQAFATGTCLAVSVLDSILSTAYYNHQARAANDPSVFIITEKAHTRTWMANWLS